MYKVKEEMSHNECPICNNKNTLKILPQEMNKVLDDMILEHIKQGFKSLGIEATLEGISMMPQKQQKRYKDLIRKTYGGRLC
jgi:hypothetical protein